MKRMTLIAIILCALMLGTVGAGVVTAKQEVNAPQKGKSPIYQFDVKNVAGAVVGKLTINTKQATYVFNANGLTAGTTYSLECVLPACNIGSAEAAADGTMHMQGPWDTRVDVTAQPKFLLSTSPMLGISPIGRVDSFILVNTGVFVARLSAEYSTDNGATWHRAGNSGDILISNSKDVELSSLGVPNYSLVRIHADVVAGYDKVGSEVFQYVSLSGHWAKYTISGTTLINRLTYNGYGADAHILHWQNTPLQFISVWLTVVTSTVSGHVLDEYNNKPSNVQYEIFDWNTKEVYKQGVAANGDISYMKTTLVIIPNCAIRILPDTQYTNVPPDTPCEIVAPPPPEPPPA